MKILNDKRDKETEYLIKQAIQIDRQFLLDKIRKWSIDVGETTLITSATFYRILEDMIDER